MHGSFPRMVRLCEDFSILSLLIFLMHLDLILVELIGWLASDVQNKFFRVDMELSSKIRLWSEVFEDDSVRTMIAYFIRTVGDREIYIEVIRLHLASFCHPIPYSQN